MNSGNMDKSQESNNEGRRGISEAMKAFIPPKDEEAKGLQNETEVPSFDLAEEIMAQQRKVTAIRRKAPEKRGKIEVLRPEGQKEERKSMCPPATEHDFIIREIVARDIERFYRGA